MSDISNFTEEPFEKQAYDMPQLWEDDWFGEEDHERIRKLFEIIPSDVSSILDVGCGNGLFLNFTSKKYPGRFSRICGTDRSSVALKHVQTEKKLARIDQLPFDNASFDLVSCMEVLEHLTLPIYPSALQELARVACKYVLVSVPYKEALVRSLVECPSCFTQFHPDYHVRSFSEDTMVTLMKSWGFKQLDQWKLGMSITHSDRELRSRLCDWVSGNGRASFPPIGLCPVCGYRDTKALDNALEERRSQKLRRVAQVESRLNTEQETWARRVLSRLMPPTLHYRWIVGLYVKH